MTPLQKLIEETNRKADEARWLWRIAEHKAQRLAMFGEERPGLAVESEYPVRLNEREPDQGLME